MAVPGVECQHLTQEAAERCGWGNKKWQAVDELSDNKAFPGPGM